VLIIKAANLRECQDNLKYVAVIFDEVHIRADLGVCPNMNLIKARVHMGELVGFCNLGDINNHLLEVERSTEEEAKQPELAKSMLVFMVRGLFGPLKFPYDQYSTIKTSLVIFCSIHSSPSP
jgi:hypothetical protein